MAIPAKPTLTTPPVAPVRGEDRVAFSIKANAYVAFIGTNVTDLTAAINWQNTVFTAVDNAADATLINADRAEAAAAVASAGVNFQGKWSDASGSASGGGSYEYEGGLWLLLSDVANIAANEPAQGSLWIDVTVYTDSEVDALLGFKANQATTYTKTEANSLLNAKANQATTYTEAEVDELISTRTKSPNETTVVGTATFTNSTNRIALPGIGSIGLEIGDVVQVTRTASNNKLFTVEVITDANNVIVNQAHAGGTSTKSLVNETVSATLTLVSKWYNASNFLGQGLVDVLSSRTSGVTYTNSTGRALFVAFNTLSAGEGGTFTLTIRIGGEIILSGASDYSQKITFLVPIGETYQIEETQSERWQEIR